MLPGYPRKSDWRNLEQLIQTNKITTLYHFTDQENLDSIRRRGGLYSWEYCENNQILIPRPGGNTLSRDLDRRRSLENYVRLSFAKHTPMFYIARRDGRLKNPRILEIDPEVIFWEETLFSDGNATANRALVGGSLSDFRNIRFDILSQSEWTSEQEKYYWQAEVLVKEYIPIKFIRNL
ncbi:DarT ssDNA thymidine ADP-ribosyltransferase family protein [Synechococcus elongatus]|uniref:DarT ssDNA thymidine ADP-ribosyltransferase family protein n=1 Tax=Synechococcus elongatus TaxID=32046 RepID=UPI000F7D5CF7